MEIMTHHFQDWRRNGATATRRPARLGARLHPSSSTAGQPAGQRASEDGRTLNWAMRDAWPKAGGEDE